MSVAFRMTGMSDCRWTNSPEITQAQKPLLCLRSSQTTDLTPDTGDSISAMGRVDAQSWTMVKTLEQLQDVIGSEIARAKEYEQEMTNR